MSFETGYSSTLSAKLIPADTTIDVATPPTATSGRMHIYKGTTHSWINYTGVSGNTLTGVTFVSQTTDPITVVAGNTFPAGTAIELVEMHDQIIDKSKPTYSKQIATTYATESARDLALGANGAALYPYVDIYVTSTELFYNYNTVTAQWESVDTGTSPVTSIVGEIRMYSGTSAPSGWFICDGTEVSRTTYSALFAVISTLYGIGNNSTTFNIPNLTGRVPIGKQSATSLGTATMTIASPCVVTLNSHGLSAGSKIYFTTTGELPTNITASTEYFVINTTTNTFQVSLTLGGVAINTAGTQSGTHTLYLANFNTLGETGGSVSHTIITAEMPSHSHDNLTAYSGGGGSNTLAIQTGIHLPAYSSTYGVSPTGGGQPHNNLQPYLIVNYIIKY